MTHRFSTQNIRALYVVLALLFAPSIAHACTSPTGTEGQIIFGTDESVPAYCDGTNWIAMTGGEGPYIPNAVEFDGTNDYLRASNTVIPLADTKRFTISFWINFNHGATRRFFTTDGFQLSIASTSTGQIFFVGRDDSTTTILDIGTSINLTDGEWNHVLASFDVTDINRRHIYIDDTNALVSVLTYTDGDIDFSSGNRSIGAAPNGIQKHSGGLADFWLKTDEYIDFSIEANRRKFIDASGNPVFLGLDGSLPTGTSPDIFLSGDTATWHTNKGTGGGFTENGALTTASSRPYKPRTNIVPNGLIGHWRLDETSGTTAFDSSGNGYDLTMFGGLTGGDAINGQVDSAIYFDGTDDFIRANTADFDIGSALTVSFWAKINVENFTNNAHIVDIRNHTGGGNSSISFRVEENDIQLESEISGFSRIPLNYLIDGKWNYYTLTYDGLNARIYVNSELDSTTLISGYTFENIDRIDFSNCCSTISYIEAGLDDVRLYNRALTAAEIAEIYAAKDGIRYNESTRTPEYFDGNEFVKMTPEPAAPTNGLVGHWKLDETSGTTAFDSSGNGNNGTMFGGVNAGNDSTPGPVGTALIFDGHENDDLMNMTYQTGSLNDEFSISFWMNPSDFIPSFTRDILGTRDSLNNTGNTVGLRVWSNGRLDLRIDTSGGAIDETVYDNNTDATRFNEWRHYTVTRKLDGEIRWYENGALYETSASAVIGNLNLSNPNLLFSIGGGAVGAARFRGGLDDVRIYDRVLTPAEVTQLYAIGTPVGLSTALPQGCPNIGDVCDDGTIYAGLSPDGNVAMFAAPEDAPTTLPWNNGTGSGFTSTGVTTDNIGEANTNTIVTIDSDSNITGFQAHMAAQYCYDLTLNGADDWYLPSRSESLNLYNGGNPIGNVLTGAGDYYWTSREGSSNSANRRTYSDGTSETSGKAGANAVRCVRKGPAPRCANPYGLEGQMVYNSTHDVVQYCDGARWVGIGKYN